MSGKALIDWMTSSAPLDRVDLAKVIDLVALMALAMPVSAVGRIRRTASQESNCWRNRRATVGWFQNN